MKALASSDLRSNGLLSYGAQT